MPKIVDPEVRRARDVYNEPAIITENPIAEIRRAGTEAYLGQYERFRDNAQPGPSMGTIVPMAYKAPTDLVSEDDIRKRAPKVRAQVRRAANGEDQTEYFNRTHEDSMIDRDVENPITKRARHQLLVDWSVRLGMRYPSIPRSEHWEWETVRLFACEYLRCWVS